MRHWQMRFLYFSIYVILTSTMLYIYRFSNFTNLPSILLKEKLNPWEKSLPGDYGTCIKMLKALQANTKDNETKVHKFFHWPTPKIENLWNTGSEIKQYCEGYNTGLLQSNVKLVKELSEYYFRYTVKATSVSVGEPIVLFIETFTHKGDKIITKGGDFFKIRVHPINSNSGVTISNIVDHHNGEYTAEIMTFWSGLNGIHVQFGQSGKFVEVLKKLTATQHPLGVQFLAEYSPKGCDRNLLKGWCSKGLTSLNECSTDNVSLNVKTVCNLTNRNGEEWYCQKPDKTFWCPDHNSYYTKRHTNALDLLKMFPKYDRGTAERKLILGNVKNVMAVDRQKSTENIWAKLPVCSPGLVTPSPAGYWYNNEWVSNVCKNSRYSTDPLSTERCLRDRTFYFLGDSTIRQWFDYFITGDLKNRVFAYKATEILSYIDVWEPRMARISKLNTTFYHKSHGAPLQNGGKKSNLKYVSNEIDAISKLEDHGRHTTISIGIGPHFFLFSPDFFLKRVIIIKEAATRLIKRNPMVTVIVKGTGTFIRGEGVGECCLSDWLSYRYHMILKHVFEGTGVVYINVWDMTLSHESEDLIHPVYDIIKEQLNMMLSFSCDRFL